jgi:hypothetical protein
VGACCQLQIVHETSKEGRTYATIAAIMALPKGTPKPRPENPPIVFSFEEAGDKPAIPPGMPEWIANIIQESKEWHDRHSLSPVKPATTAAVPAPAAEEDDVPF